jgi:hypothetical protein
MPSLSGVAGIKNALAEVPTGGRIKAGLEEGKPKSRDGASSHRSVTVRCAGTIVNNSILPYLWGYAYPAPTATTFPDWQYDNVELTCACAAAAVSTSSETAPIMPANVFLLVLIASSCVFEMYCFGACYFYFTRKSLFCREKHDIFYFFM